MIVLQCGKATVPLPIYRSKSAKFQLCTTARSIIIFMRTALPYLCFVFVFAFCFFFLTPEAEIRLNILFNTLLKITPHNTQKKRLRKKKEQRMDLHDDIRGRSTIQFLTPTDRA